MKQTVPFLIASIAGLLMIAANFFPFSQSWGEVTVKWFDILAAFAFIIGGGNLLKMNLQKVSERKAGWGFALVTVIAFLVTLFVGLGKVGTHPLADHPNHPWAAPYFQDGSSFWWVFNYVYLPLAATMFAMLAFYIASAAFRAFRAKNPEAIILLVVAFIILLGRTSAGLMLTDWIPDNTEWYSYLRAEKLTGVIMDVFNLAGNRAIMIGIALGVVSYSLKIVMGVDRSYLGSD